MPTYLPNSVWQYMLTRNSEIRRCTTNPDKEKTVEQMRSDFRESIDAHVEDGFELKTLYVPHVEDAYLRRVPDCSPVLEPDNRNVLTCELCAQLLNKCINFILIVHEHGNRWPAPGCGLNFPDS